MSLASVLANTRIRSGAVSLLAGLMTALVCGHPAFAANSVLETNRLLIVAPRAFHQTLGGFVAHKQKLLPTELVALETVLQAAHGADDAEQLKRFLYQQWRTRGLRYALLVGDVDCMPVRYMVLDRVTPAAYDYAFYPSDLYYADLAKPDGSFDDWNARKDSFHSGYYGEVRGEKNKNDPINYDEVDYRPDIAVGRWPASTPQEVEIIARKSIDYETRVLAQSESALRRAAFIVADGWVDSRSQMDRLASRLENSWQVEKHYYSDEGRAGDVSKLSREGVLALLNRGAGLVVHSGHGQPNAWEKCFAAGDLKQITNSTALPVFVSAGCSTAYFAPLAPYDGYVDIDGVEHTGTDHQETFNAPPRPPANYQRGRFNPTGLGELLLKHPASGGVAYLGCNTGSQPCGLTLVEGFVTAVGEARQPRLGDCWASAVAYYYDKECLATLKPDSGWYPPSIFFQAMKFMLFGDPSLRLQAPAPRQTRPNVLVLLSDDQRPDTIGALGNLQIRTPNLDKLVSDGTAFPHAYIMGAQQGAVCVPSRAMLMTSLGLFRVKENLRGQRTWPEQFAKAGYRTFMTGKWHNGAESAPRVFQTGRNVFFGGMSDAHNMPVQDFDNGALGAKSVASGHHTEVIAEAAMAFLRQQTNRQPFLCYVAFKSPHDPRTATPAWHQYYETNLPPLPGNFLPQHPFNNGEMSVRDEKLLPWPRTPDAVRKELADYYACVSHLDEQIGRILEVLRSTGLAKDTLIAFAGDNGLALGSHGLLGKQNLYEHSVGVPLILAGPGVPANRRENAFCYLLDVYPTLAEIAGVPPIPATDGRSLVQLFQSRVPGPRPVLFTAYRNAQRAVRDNRWKLIRYPLVNQTQLFDLQSDPLETKNLSDNPDFAETVKRMTGLLAAQQKQWGDRTPLTVPKPAPAAWSPPPALQQDPDKANNLGVQRPEPASRTNALPRLKWADTSRLGRPFAKDPSVIRFGDRYLMYFSLPPFSKDLAPSNAPSGWSIGIAESRNLVDWRKIGELWPAQECDRNGLCAPGARVLDGKVHLFYQTYGNGPKDAICHAISSDGVTFQRDASNPVFRPTGPWNSGRAIDAEVLPHGDQLLLYFATRDPTSRTQILGVAAAPLKSDFSRNAWRQICDGPILRPELPWETRCIEAPTLTRRGGTLVMFYAGGYNNDPQQIGVATSTNGIHWTRLSDTPLLPNGELGDWNYCESGHPGFFEDEDRRSCLFFQGNNDKGRTWLLSAVEIGWTNSRPFVLWNSSKLPAKRPGLSSPTSADNPSQSP